MIRRIEEIEKKIQEDREILDSLQKQMFETGVDDVWYIKEKIEVMEKDVESLSKQVARMKKIIGMEESVSSQPVQQASAQGVQPQQMQPQSEQPGLEGVQPQPVQPAPQPVQQTAAQGVPQPRYNFPAGKVPSYVQNQAQTQNQGYNQAPSYAQVQAQNQNQGYMNMNQPQPRPQVQQPKRDVESVIGKSIMGILASVLIFIAIILFGTLLVPALTDEIKIAVMFIFSIALAAISLYKLYRDDRNVLYLSLSACGMGAIYVSLFVTSIHFKAIDPIPLFVLLAIWAGVVCLLSKRFSGVFQIIGEVGIYISIWLGLVSAIDEMDSTKLFVLMIYFMLGSLIYGVTHNKNMKDIIINHVFNCLSIYTLFIGCEAFKVRINQKGIVYNSYNTRSVDGVMSDLDNLKNVVRDDTLFIPSVMLIAIFLLCLIVIMLIRNERSFGLSNGAFNGAGNVASNGASNGAGNSTFINVNGIFGAIYSVAIIIAMLFIFEDEELVMRVVGAGFCLVLSGFVAWRLRELCAGHTLWKIVLLLIAILCVEADNEDMMVLSIVGAFAIVLLSNLFGYFSGDKAYKYISVGLLFIYALNGGYYELTPVFLILGLVLVLLFYGEMLLKRETYSLKVKIPVHIISLIIIGLSLVGMGTEYDFDREMMSVAAFSIVAIINGFALKTIFADSWVDYSAEGVTQVVFSLINGFLMLFGMIGMEDTGDEFIRFIYIVVTVALFALNSANILSDDFQAGKAIKLNNGVANVYLGLKFTILVAVILNSIEAANYITSISLFVLAIICIVLGFWKDVKALRIYGLVLSILSVVKLIIVDITYENSIGRAVSFLVCGVLCFAISAIYNLVDKKYKDGM